VPYPESYKRILYKLGYYSYQEGLIYRHLKQKGGWDNHLARCRRFILQAVELLKPDKITVLGSGWLLDFPLSELMEKTKEIVLVDIIHPPDVRKQVSGLKKVKIIEEDLTGGLINEVWEKADRLPFYKKLCSLHDITIPCYNLQDKEPGMLVSLNILSQLDVLPVRFLKRKMLVTEKEVTNFRSSIQKHHLELLLKHKSVLITDVKEIFIHRDGSRSEEQTVTIPLPRSDISEEWTWDFDLTYTDYYGKQSVLEVVAMLLK